MLLPGGIGRPTGMHLPAVVSLVRRLSLQAEVSVYSFVKPDLDSEPFHCGEARVRYIRAEFGDRAPKKIVQYMRSFFEDHRQKKFDLIHAFWAFPCGWTAVVLGKLCGIPAIVSLQGGEAADLPHCDYGDMRKQPLKSLTLWACRKATALTTLTNFQQRELRRFGVSRDSAVIPHGAERDFFANGRNREASAVKFLHVGFSNRVKDQGTLLKAFDLVRRKTPARLRMIGGGPLDEELKILARSLGLGNELEFLGYVPHSELPQHYSWADALLHTSLYEAEGVAVAEAAASRVLICGTEVGLISDLGPDASVSVSPGEYTALAGKILKILAQPEEAARLRRNAYGWVCAHDADWTAHQFRMLYNRVLGLSTTANA